MLINLKKTVFHILVIFFLYSISMNVQASIVTMLKPLGFIAAAIADKITSVEVIIPDGMSIHNYSLRPLDIIKIKNADFLIIIGDTIEPLFFHQIAHKFKKQIITLSTLKSITPLLIHQSIDKKSLIRNKKIEKIIDYDMHVWLSPKIAIETAIAIHQKLIEIMPQKKNIIDQNLRKFKVNLLYANQTIKNKMMFFNKKNYFSFHNAYKYFEKHYKLSSIGYFHQYIGIPIGAQSLYAIKKKLITKKAACIFIEPQFNTRIIDIIIYGTKIRKGFLDPLGIKIPLSKNSYMKFILELSNQYVSCLKEKKDH